ncbi:hypothetical protein [Blastopirellula marina]|uniref:DUF4214 domain-containing protein n=1 Tax=Blastopirellula marina TaxID=124 RepID=A0A2S8GND7_9BACT|nr:hypothetical protein [Blastopirellula marina]PQO45544.1 hypothetical protein C5Y93_13960 [Blastopirellula marina]
MDSLREKVLQSIDVGDLLAPQDDVEFIRLAYRRVLGHSASKHCIEQWMPTLKDKTTSRVEFLNALSQSKTGRRHNVHVVGLEMLLKEERKEKPRKRKWWKRLLPKLRFSRRKPEDTSNLTNLDRRVASLTADWLNVTENIEHQFRQLRSSVNCGTLPLLPNLHVEDPRIDQQEIQANIEQMHASMAMLQDTTPVTSLEKVLAEVQQHAMASRLEQNFLCNWLLATQSVCDVLRGCRAGGIEIANWSAPPAALEFIRSLNVHATQETSLTEFLSSQPLASAGGILLESKLAALDDHELIKCLLLASSALKPGGCLLIVEGMPNPAFQTIRLQSALQACGFTIPTSAAELQSKHADSIIMLAETPVGSEVHCDS